MNKIDKYILNGFLILILIVLYFLIIRILPVASFLGYITWLLIRSVFLYFSGRYKNKKKISVKDLEEWFALEGTVKQADLILSLLPAAYSPVKNGNVITYNRHGEKIFLLCNYKFSSTSAEDIARLYQNSSSVLYDKLVILGKTPPKNVLLLADKLPFDVLFPSSKKVYAFLADHNALPEPSVRLKRKKRTWKNIFDDIFSIEKARYYFPSAFLFLLYAILFKRMVWYYIFFALSLLLGTICLLFYWKKARSQNKNKSL